MKVTLWLAAAVISGFTLRRFIGPLDEGILMQAATRMADGQWPWRDFGWSYGPGEPLVVMTLGKVFGPSLLWWRLLRVAADATAALLVYLLVRDRRPGWALPAWAATAVTAAQPTSANPTGPALAFALGSVVAATRGRPAWAGILAALAAFWRPDVGAIAALAAAATLLVASRREEGEAALPDAETTPGAPTAGTAVPAEPSSGAASPAEAPSSSGAASPAEPSSSGTASRAEARSSSGAVSPSAPSAPDAVAPAAPDAVAPSAASSSGVGSTAAAQPPRAATSRAGPTRRRATPRRAAATCLAVAAAGLLVLYAPFLVVAGPGRVWDALVVQSTKDGAWWRLPFGYGGGDAKDFVTWLLPFAAVVTCALAARRAVGLAVLGVGGAVYFASRADLEHAQGLLIVAAAAAAFARPRLVGATLLALLLAVGLANRASALLKPPDLKPFESVAIPPREAATLPRLIEDVRRRVPEGEPIYVAPRRSDLVTFANPLLYYLVGRPNVLHRDFLLQARPEEQAAIVRALRRARPKVIVRWTAPESARPEPNRRGRPSGSRALDNYLDEAYRPDARYGDYELLVPR